MRRAALATAAIAALASIAGDLHAEVTSIGAGGFVSTHSVEVGASPDTAYRGLTREISQWWDGAHSWSGDAANLYMDPRPGGCFCEKLPDGGGVEHLRIIYLAPASEIRLTGALGPLQTMGLQGTMTWKITPTGAGSRLDWQYTVHGHLAGGYAGIAPAVDGVVGAQLQRLADWLEPAGEPAGSE